VRGDHPVPRVEDVEPVVVEGRQCSDDAAHHRHWMRAAPEPAIDRVQLLVDHRVMADVVGEPLELRRRRQLAVEQQPANFQIAAILDEVGDRIATIEKDAVVAVDVSDRRATGTGLTQCGVIGKAPGIFMETANIDHRRADGGLQQRQLWPHVAAVDTDFDGPRVCGCAHWWTPFALMIRKISLDIDYISDISC
jgi:hypothetical protein